MVNYKGFDGTAWRWCGIAVIILGFAISVFEIWGMWQVGSIGVPSVKNQLIAVAIGLIVFAIQVILQAKGSRQLMYSVVANKVGNEATPCEKAQNKQMLLWIVFADLCIFAISYGVSIAFGDKLFLAIGLPLIGVAMFTVMGFAIKGTIRYKGLKRKGEKGDESLNERGN